MANFTMALRRVGTFCIVTPLTAGVLVAGAVVVRESWLHPGLNTSTGIAIGAGMFFVLTILTFAITTALVAVPLLLPLASFGLFRWFTAPWFGLLSGQLAYLFWVQFNTSGQAEFQQQALVVGLLSGLVGWWRGSRHPMSEDDLLQVVLPVDG